MDGWEKLRLGHHPVGLEVCSQGRVKAFLLWGNSYHVDRGRCRGLGLGLGARQLWHEG